MLGQEMGVVAYSGATDTRGGRLQFLNLSVPTP